MKKKTLHISFFLAILIGFFIYLNKVFASRHYYVNTTQDYIELARKTNVDVVIYGSSHAYTAFNPLILNDVCKTISYNLGSDGLKMQLTDIVLEESLKYNTPKLIILEIYPSTLTSIETDPDKGYHLRAMDFVSNFSEKKWKKTKRVYDLDEYMSVYFPLVRNHEEWNKKKYFDLSRRRYINQKENFYYGGFLGSKLIIDDINLEKHKGFSIAKKVVDTTRNMISDQAKKDIESFFKIAKTTGAELFVVSSPDPRAKLFFNYDFFNQLEAYCQSKGVSVLNLNDYYAQMNLTIKDFKDTSHLNTFGSIKASSFLAKYINANFDLEDRSNEDVWVKEHKIYESFRKEYSSTFVENFIK
ncbi:hypothetical protein [Patiriisocius sp. Uisw_017]|jgi:hypothetical protein|uniref:hypothetical protein n=1 Tax=Patiriisocius sp. Uisw_017 TaxID=3230968 RepID=UPI0039E7B292